MFGVAKWMLLGFKIGWSVLLIVGVLMIGVDRLCFLGS